MNTKLEYAVACSVVVKSWVIFRLGLKWIFDRHRIKHEYWTAQANESSLVSPRLILLIYYAEQRDKCEMLIILNVDAETILNRKSASENLPFISI